MPLVKHKVVHLCLKNNILVVVVATAQGPGVNSWAHGFRCPEKAEEARPSEEARPGTAVVFIITATTTNIFSRWSSIAAIRSLDLTIFILHPALLSSGLIPSWRGLLRSMLLTDHRTGKSWAIKDYWKLASSSGTSFSPLLLWIFPFSHHSNY